MKKSKLNLEKSLVNSRLMSALLPQAAHIFRRSSRVPKEHAFNTPKSECCVGIEIEAEGFLGNAEVTPACLQWWTQHAEGSLRNHGVEFVSAPISNAQIGYALALLQEMNKAWSLKYNDLTGLHVHLNVLPLTWGQFKNLWLLFVLFETQLFQVSGNRYSSVFCCPLRSSISGVPEFLFKDDLEDGLNLGNNKYLSMGYHRLCDLGTVEVRMARGTDDILRIQNWISILLYVWEAARRCQFEQMRNRIFSLSTDSTYYEFVIEVLKEQAKPLLYRGYEQDMAQGISTLKSWSIMHSRPVVNDEPDVKRSRPPQKAPPNAFIRRVDIQPLQFIIDEEQ